MLQESAMLSLIMEEEEELLQELPATIKIFIDMIKARVKIQTKLIRKELIILVGQ